MRKISINKIVEITGGELIRVGTAEEAACALTAEGAACALTAERAACAVTADNGFRGSTDNEIKETVSVDVEPYITGVKHDSREVEPGDMFVAIKGENMDGHRFIPQVVKAGCTAVLVSHTDGWPEELKRAGAEAAGMNDAEPESKRPNFAGSNDGRPGCDGTEAGRFVSAILVDDTIEAMGMLAAWYLESLNIPKVAVTGSVGKTSTRDMIYYVLSEKYRCGRNLKNFNNNIGLPISIFRFDETTEAAVLEMGMDAFGEIDYLSRIVKPDIGVITNIGVAHIEKLGSREGIFRAKMEIAGNIASREKGGTLVFASDEKFLTRERTRGDYDQVEVTVRTGDRVRIVGQNQNDPGHSSPDYIVTSVDDYGIEGIKFSLLHDGEEVQVKIPIPGVHNAVNAALALAVGERLGVSLEKGAEGLAKASLTGSRLKKIEAGNITVIDDTYNANPDSMKSALDVLAASKANRRVAILGDMFELGEESDSLHRSVGEHCRKLGIDVVISIGDMAANIQAGSGGIHFSDKESFIKKADEYIEEGDLILVKASRGMKMEEIVRVLTDGENRPKQPVMD